MKKFIEEFKIFALKGNMVDMAVGIVIGTSFSGIVTSLTDNLINTILMFFTVYIYTINISLFNYIGLLIIIRRKL